jgi:hypothetical protein
MTLFELRAVQDVSFGVEVEMYEGKENRYQRYSRK